MSATLGGVLILLLAWPAGGDQDKPKDKPITPADQYKALVKSFSDARTEFFKVYNATKDKDEKQKLVKEKYPSADKFTGQFLELAQKYPKDPAALDALVWVATNGRRSTKDVTKALEMLHHDHVLSPRLGPVCRSLATAIDRPSVAFLQDILAKNPEADVKGEACIALGQSLQNQAGTIRQVAKNPDDLKAYTEFYGQSLMDELRKRDPAKLDAESAQLFRQAADKYVTRMKGPELENLCQRLGYTTGRGGEVLLRALLEKDSRHEVQGQACFALAQLLKRRADDLPAEKEPEAVKTRKESEQLFERIVAKFADLKTFRGTMGEKAKNELFAIRFLSVGKPAPEIEGEDQDGVKFKLSDYRGKVVLLDFWGNW
jgi:hypothetical protein